MIDPWRFFPVEVLRLTRLSPSFARVTFTGPELEFFADNGYDQRFKLLFDGVRRTYTVRAVRNGLSEVDVDMVLHPGGDGPAITWLRAATVGSQLGLIGPDLRFDGVHGGIDFRLPQGARRLLLAGDETAVPAVASILERLPSDLAVTVVLEVPYQDDFLPLPAASTVDLRWLAREGAPHGSLLIPAVQEAAAKLTSGGVSTQIEDVDVDRDLLWEVPEDQPATDSYAWLAGEAATIKALRRHLVGELGLDRRSVAFMGYWRLGRSEGAE